MHALPCPTFDLQICNNNGQMTVLGEGGQAIVYEGRLRGKAVAIKVRGILKVPEMEKVRVFASCMVAQMLPCPLVLQVFELQPGLDSRVAWREVSLLRQCVHERLVPLLGVALTVGAVGEHAQHSGLATLQRWRKPSQCVTPAGLLSCRAAL